MIYYRATGNKQLVREEAQSSEPTYIKLRVELICPTNSDIAIYQGKLNIDYPIVPCSMATAIVSEDYLEYGLKRGTKVILNPYQQLGLCNGYTSPLTYGIHLDGFLANFIEMPIDNIIPFPDGVKSEEAVFTNIIAVAIKAISELPLEKGTYVAVLGGSVLGLIISQLLMYYQAIPIFISNDDRYLDIAEECGICYRLDEAKEEVVKTVFDITGGKMADYAILNALPWSTSTHLGALSARGGECRIVSLNPEYVPRIDINISDYVKKNLTIKGVSCGEKEINSAINLLALKQTTLLGLIDKMVSLEEAPTLFQEMSAQPNKYVCPIIKA